MVSLKLLIVTLTFFELFVNVDAQLRCPKGERVEVHGHKKKCSPCHKETYQPGENESQSCKACTQCNTKSGSDPIQECTKDTNRKCQCRGNFTPLDKSNNSTCKCDIGFELKSEGCSECEVGYFSTSIDSTCRKWRECKSGVLKAGSRTTDAICKKSNGYNGVSATPTPNNIVPAETRFTSDRPHEGAQTQKIHTTTTTSAPRHIIITGSPVQPSTAGNHIGVILILGIVLLLVLTAVACKQHTIPRERPQTEQNNESLCRKPVEESGHSSEALLKQNP